MQPEQRVKREIKKRMKALAPDSWDYMPPGGPYGKAGVPDHLFCVPVTITPDMVGRTVGVFVGIEAKTATGKPTANQKIQLEAIREAGGVGVVVRPGNIDKVFEGLKWRFGDEQDR